jgi:hypothetical protein
MIFRAYQNHFENWTKKTFDIIHAKLRNVLKTHLRIKGIYIFVGARGRVSQQFANLLTIKDCPIWLKEDLLEIKEFANFKCLQKPKFEFHSAA